MNVRVIVADQRDANFFDVATPQAHPQACGSLHNDAARPDRDLETDRPGRRLSGSDNDNRLVLIAAPRMLGLLREALPAACRSVVAAEVSKDFVHHDLQTIRDAIPQSAFAH